MPDPVFALLLVLAIGYGMVLFVEKVSYRTRAALGGAALIAIVGNIVLKLLGVL